MSGYMGAGSTPRRPLDFYPTPRPVTWALARWLNTQPGAPGPRDSFLDPAAGTGELIEGMRDGAWGEAHYRAIDIDPSRAAILDEIAEWSTIGDALDAEWHEAHVVENPSFGLLDAFWIKTAEHRARHRVWCAALTPVAWWNAEKRAGYTRPDFMLALGWRPTFHGKTGPAHKGSQDFAWSVLAPTPRRSCEWVRLEKPSATTVARSRAA